MRVGFFTILAVGTVACSQLPTQNSVVGGDIVTTRASDFAVFAENGAAVAIRMGTSAIDDDMAFAINAIKRATGCDVLAGSIMLDPKFVSADLACKTNRQPELAQKPHL